MNRPRKLDWARSGRLGLLVLATLWATGALAQPHPFRPAELRWQDSLRHRLQADQRPDTARVNRLYSLGFALRTNDAAQAIRLFWPAMKLARQLHYEPGLTNALFGLGYCYRASNAYDSARYYTQRAIALAARTGQGFNQTRGLYNLARIYHEQGNYGPALAVGLRSLALAQARHDRRAQLFAHTQLGLTNMALGEYATAQQHLGQALAVAQALPDPIGSGHAYTALGDLSRAQSHWPQAGRYYAQAAAAYRPVYNAVGLLPTELNQAEMLARQGQCPTALRTAHSLLRRALATGTSGQVARAQLLLATGYLATGQPDTARRYAVRSLATTHSRGLKPEAYAAAQVLAQACAALGRWPEAYRY